MHRSVFVRLAAVLASALLLTTGLHAPTDAAPARTVKRVLSMAPSVSSGVAGTPVRFAGRISRSPVGTVVMLQRRVGAKWLSVRGARTTTKAGNYSIQVSMPPKVGSYAFRTVSAKRGKLRTAISVTRVIRSLTKVVVTANQPASVPAGSKFTLTGTVKPYVVNSQMQVQKLSGGTWVPVEQLPVLSGGNYNGQVLVGPTSQFRVMSPPVGWYAIGYSPTITVTTTPAISTQGLKDAVRTEKYSAQLRTLGGESGTWSIVSGSLPSGLSLAPSTGIISGTPKRTTKPEPGATDEVKPFSVVFKRPSTGQTTPPRQLSIRVDEADTPVPTIDTAAPLPNATRMSSYSFDLTAIGPPNTASVNGTWSAQNLPVGLSINNNGTITGTPTENADLGDRTVTVKFKQDDVIGRLGLSTQKNYALRINQAASPVISNTSLSAGTRNSPYNADLNVNGNPAGVWEVTNAGKPLPPGLSLNTTTGQITGTPTGALGDNFVEFAFTQTSTGLTAKKTFNIKINEAAPVITTSSLPTATRMSAYSTTLTATGPPSGDPVTGIWEAVSGLPAGLSIEGNQIVGTPTSNGDLGANNVTIKFTQSDTNLSVQKVLVLTVEQADPPVINTPSLPTGTRHSSYNADLNATVVGASAGTWSVVPALPTGLSLNTATGQITGTPTSNADVGDNELTFTFTQTSTGLSGHKTFTLKINQAGKPTITTGSLDGGTVGVAYSFQLKATGPGNDAGTWTVTGLPDGLTYNPSTGEISGTPTTEGASQVTIAFTQTNTGFEADPKELTLTIAPAAP